jgi:formylglycine-generating enzyme required for sulfatase activity
MLVVGGVITGYILTRSTPSTSGAGATTTTTNPTSGTGTSIKADLVEIPGGTFLMGRNDGPPQERPQHEVTVQTFYMDRTEVTNEEYAEFVRDMRVEPPTHWVRGKPLPLQEKWPVVNVSPKDAEAFAAWRSARDGVTYRLPTEEEWEYAARSGGEYKLYPWGDRWEDNKAVVKDVDAKPVGKFPQGANRWGVVDLIGNVWEWTSSKASLYPGSRLGEIPAATKDWVVARGGSYSSDPQDRQIPISATYRDWFDTQFRQPNYGFRLVRPVQ